MNGTSNACNKALLPPASLSWHPALPSQASPCTPLPPPASLSAHLSVPCPCTPLPPASPAASFFSQIGACRCVLALRSADQWPMAVQWPEANGSAVAYLRPMSLFLSATAPALSRPSRSMHCTMRLASALCFPLCLAVTSVTSLCFPVSPNMPRM